MRPAIQQLVVTVQSSAADCGTQTAYVLGMSAGKIVRRAAWVNACSLNATFGPHGNSITLSGPYYSAAAALCCPTKPRAASTIRFTRGKWVQTPVYFKSAAPFSQ